MNKIGGGILVVAIVLAMIAGSSSKPGSGPRVTGILNSLGSTARRSRKPRTEPKAKLKCEIEEGTFRYDLIDSLQRTLSRGPIEEAEQCAEDFSVKDEEIRKRLHVVFAIVPDPVHTNLSLFFDRQMDAIQQGITDSGWYFEQGLMPWDNKEHPESDDFHLRLEQKVYEDDQADEPGLMLFRYARNVTASDAAFKLPPDRLLVFVISESPTAGVQKVQFRHAVALVKQFFGKNTPARLPVFGPTFSGSLRSLADLLRSEGSNAFSTADKAVYSGTVTGFPNIERFKDITGIPFFSLQENDDYVLKVFAQFANNTWGYANKEITILSEDETPYGSGENDASDPSKPVFQSTGPPDLVRIYFPRGISQLRSAYQHNVNAADTTAGKAPKTGLPLELDSSSRDDFSTPEYSGKQYPLSQEAVLVSIVRELQLHHTQLVVLRATDPLDLIFFGRYLRQAYPDGRIITLSSDLLFTRELEDARLHGVMALTTYPLTFGADPPLAPGAELLDSHTELKAGRQRQEPWVSPSTHSIGSYNAMRLLLADNIKVKVEEDELRPKEATAKQDCPNSSVPHCPVHLLQYGWPGVQSSSPEHPPVYLTVLGHEGYWQVTLLSATPFPNPGHDTGNTLPDVADPQTQNAVEINHESPPAGWNVFWITAILVSLAYVYFIWSASLLSSSQAVAQLAPSRRDSRRYLVALAAYLHFAVLMALLWLYTYQPQLSSSWPKFCLIAVLILVVLAGVSDLYRRNCGRLAVWLALATGLTPLLLLLMVKEDYFHQMSYYRSMHLGSGVSDLLPVMLFLAAGLWGVWYSLSGTSLLDSSRTLLPRKQEIESLVLDSHILDPHIKGRLHRFRGILEEDQSRLTRVIKPDSIDPRAALLSLIVVLLVLLYTSFRPLRAFEPRTHEYLLAALASGCFAFLIAGAVRLHNIWLELRRLLITLDSVPLRQGFMRLKDFSWSPLWRLGGGNLGDFRRLVSLQAEALRGLFKLKTPIVSDLERGFNIQAQKAQARYEDALDYHLAEPSKHPAIGNSGFEPAPDSASAAGESVGAIHGTQAAGAAPAPARKPLLAEKPMEQFRPFPPPGPLKWLILLVPPLGRWLRKVREQGEKENSLLLEFEKLQQKFATAALHTLAYLVSEWDSEKTAAASNIDEHTARTEEKAKGSLSAELKPQGESEMRHAAERFLALLYTSFIVIVLVRIRTLIITIAGMYVLCLLALTTYPFQPQVEIKIFLLLLLLFMTTLVGTVYMQMHRDATLINITNIESGQLKLSFLLRMASFVALPVFSLVASQYPEIGNLLYSWLEPALNALK